MKNVYSIHRQGEGHWVGDGFPVHTIFHYEERPELSPFILLDHAGPARFDPAAQAKGVDWHPHRGFETVTVIYDGEVVHQDTAGNGGGKGPGEGQGENHRPGPPQKGKESEEVQHGGGRLAGVQHWGNLPPKTKKT